MRRPQLLRNAAGTDPVDRLLEQDLLGLGREVDPYFDQGTMGLGDAFEISDPTSGYARKHSTGTRNSKTARDRVKWSLTYWHCRAADLIGIRRRLSS